MHKSESYGKPVGRPATGIKKVVVNLNLQIETERRLAELSKETNRSKSAIADEAIVRYLENI